MHGLRNRVWQTLEGRPGAPSHRVVNLALLGLIIVSLVTAAALTMESVAAKHGRALWWIEAACVAVFSVEYLARLWACVEGPAKDRPLAGRARFALRPMMLVDLAAILPFFISAIPLLGPYMRALRLLRLARLAKASRSSRALALLRRAVASRAPDLVLSAGLMAVVLVLAAFVLYEVEHDAQPESFSSVHATLWWAVATLTTVGYGDMYPVTPLGKTLTGVFTIAGIGIVALPTAILATGFLDALRDSPALPAPAQTAPADPAARCPSCGQPMASGSIG